MKVEVDLHKLFEGQYGAPLHGHDLEQRLRNLLEESRRSLYAPPPVQPTPSFNVNVPPETHEALRRRLVQEAYVNFLTNPSMMVYDREERLKKAVEEVDFLLGKTA